MILMDEIGHLVSNVGSDELHEFAEKIGLRRAWYIGKDTMTPHYLLNTVGYRHKALEHGALKVTPKQLLTNHWMWDKKHEMYYPIAEIEDMEYLI